MGGRDYSVAHHFTNQNVARKSRRYAFALQKSAAGSSSAFANGSRVVRASNPRRFLRFLQSHRLD